MEKLSNKDELEEGRSVMFDALHNTCVIAQLSSPEHDGQGVQDMTPFSKLHLTLIYQHVHGYLLCVLPQFKLNYEPFGLVVRDVT